MNNQQNNDTQANDPTGPNDKSSRKESRKMYIAPTIELLDTDQTHLSTTPFADGPGTS